MFEAIFGVWSIPVLAFTACGGFAFGFIAIGYAIRNPRFSSGLATPRENALLALFMAIGGGGVFWFLQLAGAYFANDEFWWRIASRFTVWLVFCIAIAIGAYLAARHDRSSRSKAARARVLRGDLGDRQQSGGR